MIVPKSPYHPHGPIKQKRLINSVDEWNDREKAAYIMADIQKWGINSIDDDKWVQDFLIHLLWVKINEDA